MSTLPGLLPFLALAASYTASAAMIKPVSVTASSSYPTENGVSYEARNAGDRLVSNVWVEGEEGSGLGSWLLFDLGQPYDVSSVTLWTGNWYSWDFWNRHNRVKEVQVEFADGSVQNFVLKNEKAPETITFPKPVRTASMRFRIKSVYPGTTFPDSCFSEIEINDNRPDAWIAPSSFADSGHLPEDADGSYGVDNTYDEILDTMWCENQKSGDGTGSWIEHRFSGPTQVSKLVLRMGNAYNLKFWMDYNRAKAGTLIFSDGTKESITIKDIMMDQTITFPAHTTTSVRLVFSDVVRGKDPKYNDLCVSEARFQP